MTKLMIYGAAVYAGGMAAEHAASTELTFVLASREKGRTRLKARARQLGAEARLFSSAIRVEWPLLGTARQFSNDRLRGAFLPDGSGLTAARRPGVGKETGRSGEGSTKAGVTASSAPIGDFKISAALCQQTLIDGFRTERFQTLT